jgi:hypothetical protein
LVERCYAKGLWFDSHLCRMLSFNKSHQFKLDIIDLNRWYLRIIQRNLVDIELVMETDDVLLFAAATGVTMK